MGCGRSWRARGGISRGWGRQSIGYISQGTCTERWIDRHLTHHCHCWSPWPQVHFLAEEAEMLPTDQLILSSEEKRVPIWSPLAMLQKHSTELLGICVSHRSTNCSCQQLLARSGSRIELRKIIYKVVAWHACWGTMKKKGDAQWQQVLNEQLLTFLSRPASGWVLGVK